MAIRFTRWAIRTGALGLGFVMVCARLGAGDAAAKGERIQESSTARPVDLPPTDPTERLGNQRFMFLEKDSSVSGVLELGTRLPPGSSEPQLSSKALGVLQQKADDQRNWIFLTPETRDRTQTAEEAFGVDPDRQKKPQGVVAEFLAGKGARSEVQAMENQLWEAGPADKLRSVDNNVRQSLARGPGFDLRKARPAARSTVDSRPGFLSPSSTSPATGTETIQSTVQASGLTAFGNTDPTRAGSMNIRLLLGGGGINPLSPGFDPISLGPDTTRRELNPILPQRPKDDLLQDPTQMPRNASLAQQGLLDEMNSRIQGPAALTTVGSPQAPKTRTVSPIWSAISKQ